MRQIEKNPRIGLSWLFAVRRFDIVKEESSALFLEQLSMSKP